MRMLLLTGDSSQSHANQKAMFLLTGEKINGTQWEKGKALVQCFENNWGKRSKSQNQTTGIPLPG